jgi:non-ribosomal peptide synthetase component F/acyl carrier protein
MDNMTKAPLIFDKAMQEARRYWRDRLEAISYAGHIDLDHPRRRDGGRTISSFDHSLDSSVSGLLERVSAGNAFLRFTCLLVGLKICCSKYSGQSSVTIFCPSEPQAGPANLLPIGSIIEPGATFRDTLVATKQLLAESYRRQSYPLSRMLFDVPESRRPKHLHMIAAFEGFNGTVPDEECDIAAVFQTRNGATTALIRWDAALLDEATIRQFFLTFDMILGAGLREMSRPIAELASEVSCVAGTEPCCAEPAAAEKASVYERIECHSSRCPDALAVIDGDRLTTYGLICQHAGKLADAIRASGVDVGRPIAILLDASTDFIVSMCGVLKAGCSFAPIRPLSATHSTAEMLSALGCECIICSEEHLPYLREAGTGLRHAITVDLAGSVDAHKIVSCDLDGTSVSPQAGARPAPDGLFRPACVLLNGRVKELSATPVDDADLLALFDWLTHFYGIGPTDRCLLTPSLGLCEQLFDTLGMLTCGASVEIPQGACANDAANLARRLMSGTITVWDVPTALMQNMLSDLSLLRAGPEGVNQPRAILLTGEKQCSVLSSRLRELFPAARIGGLYAAPGTQLWTTAFPVGERVAERHDGTVAQPIRSFEHRVLNPQGEPVPPLAKGELYVSGSLTASRRSSTVSTGMRVQRLDSSRLRWLRGEEHRFPKFDCFVELTDVEAALSRHDDIAGAEVLSVGDAPNGGGQVVAFIVTKDQALSAEAARDFLVVTGGVDLIPDRFVILDEFPLLADGAIDRDALLRDFVSRAEGSTSQVSAASPEIRATLKSLWLEVLQIADVDEDESFFTRGGNSLKATLLIARIRNEFGVELSVQSFFRQPTPHAVAELIAAETTKGVVKEREPEFQAVSRERYRVQLSATNG